MFLAALSPARTPSKSANVEKLLSLQKSSKHLSDADILSVAAEASAMKRQQAKFTTNLENVEPNTRTLPRRLFDISECSKGATGFYVSPEKAPTDPDSEQHSTQQNTIADSDSDSDIEEETETDANQQAEKHFAEILTIVNKKANKQKAPQAPTNITSLPTTAVTTTAVNTTAPTTSATTAQNEQNTTFAHSSNDQDHGHTFDDYAGSEPSTAKVEAPSVDAIKDLVVRHILNVLNTGTYDEILALHGIGQVRALRIFTIRNAGATFDSMQDFADCVYMNDYVLQRFLKANAASIML